AVALCCPFSFRATARTASCTLSLHDALPIYRSTRFLRFCAQRYCAKGENRRNQQGKFADSGRDSEKNGIRRVSVHRQVQKCRVRSEEHTSELQSLAYLVCRLLLEKKNPQATP